MVSMWQKKIDAQSIESKILISQQHCEIYPDQWQIDGDLLKFPATWIEGKQIVQFSYKFKSKNEKNLFLENKKTAIFLFSGEIKQPDSFTNENQFDYRQFLRSKNIANTVYISDLKEVENYQNKLRKSSLLSFIHNIRKYLIDYFGKIQQPLSGYCQLLLIGYYDSDFNGQIDIINKLGLLYLFSLSGMHVFYIIIAIRWLFTKLHVSDEICSFVLLLVLPLYLIIGGSSASLVRAVMMSWLIIANQSIFKTKLSGITAESCVLITNLYLCPGIIFSMGAQLSYLLTFILLINKEKGPVYLGLKLTIYSIPIVLWNTYEWNWLTAFLSIGIIPFFEWLIIPAVIIGSTIPILTFFCNKILVGFTAIFNFLSSLPFTWNYGKPPLFFVVFWSILFLLLERKKGRYKLFLYILISFILCAIIIRYPLNEQVIYFDIGQGDSTLIVEKFNKKITLIDTGGKISFNNEEWRKRESKTTGETIIANYLLSKGISEIDNLFLTHQDTDHVGNFPTFSKKIKIDNLFVPDGMEKLASFVIRLNNSAVKKENVHPISTAKVKRIGLFKILHPFGQGNGENKDSITVTFKLSGVSFIISGDLDQAGEKEVIKKNKLLKADILKTGHHGSKTSTAKEYVEQLKPKFAIISAGRNNRYGHPNVETLETLNGYHVPYVNTAEVGMIKILPTGNHEVKVETLLKGNGVIK